MENRAKGLLEIVRKNLAINPHSERYGYRLEACRFLKRKIGPCVQIVWSGLINLRAAFIAITAAGKSAAGLPKPA